MTNCSGAWHTASDAVVKDRFFIGELLETGVVFDQLNVGELAISQTPARCFQLCELHTADGGAAADVWLEERQLFPGQAGPRSWPSFGLPGPREQENWVAGLQEEAAVFKDRFEGREECLLASGVAGGSSGDGGDGAESPAIVAVGAGAAGRMLNLRCFATRLGLRRREAPAYRCCYYRGGGARFSRLFFSHRWCRSSARGALYWFRWGLSSSLSLTSAGSAWHFHNRRPTCPSTSGLAPGPLARSEGPQWPGWRRPAAPEHSKCMPDEPHSPLRFLLGRDARARRLQ